MKKSIYVLILSLLSINLWGQGFNPNDPGEPGNKYKLTLNCNPQGTGSVYGAGQYSKGEVVYLSSYPKSGYTFSCWKKGDNVISTSSNFDYKMENVETILTAVFTANGGTGSEFNPNDPNDPNSSNTINDTTGRHTLTILCDPVNGGSINQKGKVVLKKGETLYLYVQNISAGHIFDGWYIHNKLLSIQNGCSYTMGTNNDTIQARFKYNPSDPKEPGSTTNTDYLLITTQAQLEQYANIEELPRSARIMGTDITSLQSLSKMKTVNGDLRIENTSLTSLEGLDNLSKITGKLMILQNRLLTTMSGVYSWNDIYYVLIEGNPALINYCSMMAYANKGALANGAIRENAYNPTFENITNGNCSKNEDVFKVESCKVYRQLNQLHCVLQFSNEPYGYSSLSSLITMKSSQDSLKLRSFVKNNLAIHLYFDLPSKNDWYVLNVSKNFKDSNGKTLNQNENSYLGEENDSFTDSLNFTSRELHVVNHAPLTETTGSVGNTDFYFNGTPIKDILPSQITMTSPTGKNIPVNSVTYLANETPARYHVEYTTLTEDGNYSFVLSSANVKSTDEKTMNFDYEATIELPSVNFVPVSVSIDSTNWISGTKQKLSYKVKNTGTKAASGKWVDVVYLSSSNKWNSDAVELYRDTVSATVNSGENYENSITVTAPTVIDGKYFILIKSNVSQSIKETTYTDNTFVASDQINASVVELSDANSSFTLGRGESKMFKVPVTDGKNIEISDSYGLANLSMGYSDLPRTNDKSNNASISILAADKRINYYLLVSNNPRNATKEQTCKLSTKEYELQISSIGISKIIKYGTVWIPVEVIGCSAEPKFALIDQTSKKHYDANVKINSETSFQAEFNTDSLQAGAYDLYVESNGLTGIKSNSITISSETPNPVLTTNIVTPKSARVGSTQTMYIDLTNNGNVEIDIPLLILSGTNKSVFNIPGSEKKYNEEIQIIGLNKNKDGIINRIRPNETVRIPVEVYIDLSNGGHTHVKYTVKVNSTFSSENKTAFYLQWIDVEPSIVPNVYTTDEWTKYTTKLRSLVGNTWGSFLRELSNATYEQYQYDIVDFDAHKLYNYIKEMAWIENDSTSSLNKIPQKKAIIDYNVEPIDVEPGTLYLWNSSTNHWDPLVVYNDTIKDFQLYEYGISTASRIDWNKPFYFVSHGMNNDRLSPASAGVATALGLSTNSNIIGIDWGRDAKLAHIDPKLSASKIKFDAQKAFSNLLLVRWDIYNYLRNFTFIGHSHGAHLCAQICTAFHNKYGVLANRLICLDASEEMAHNSATYFGNDWKKENCADFVDYYKSSILFGEETLQGNDNFILIDSNGRFKKDKTGEISGKNHGYSYEWLVKTMFNYSELGIDWNKNKFKKKSGKGSLNGSHWSGVIRGNANVIECLSIRDSLKNISVNDWNYPGSWLKATSSDVQNWEWDFRDCLAGTFEYESCGIDYYSSDKFIRTGTIDFLNAKFKNRADNLSIPKDIRYNKVYDNVVNALYVSSENSDTIYSFKSNSDVKLAKPMYYLGESSYYYPEPNGNNAKTETAVIQFNIKSDLWKELGGTDDKDFINCYFWFVAGIDKNNTAYKEEKVTSIKFWEGELYVKNNLKPVLLKVQNPNLSCKAGENKTYKLSKGETVKSVSIEGKVLRDGGKILEYLWANKAGQQFSSALQAVASLAVGTHPLTFKIKAKKTAQGISAKIGQASGNESEAEDEVVITVKPYTPGDDENGDIEAITANDPNEKVGIKGAGSKNCVKPSETLDYSIYFENDPKKANAPAQIVTVLDTLNTAFDLSTFEFTGAKVANKTIDIPSGLNQYSTITDLRPANNLLLKTDLKMDIDSRVVRVVFTSLDTLTGEFTKDPWAGFLPPNDSTHVGEGHFSYRLKLKESLSDGYCVTNRANIYFDYNDPMLTNTTSHIIDISLPASTVDDLPSQTKEDSVIVSWSGIDSGAGIKYYDIYYSDNDSSYVLWQNHTTVTQAPFYGKKEHTYKFYSIATDSLNLVELTKANAEATVEFTNAFTVAISKKWNDVLVCNNTEKLFSSYQWYKNDAALTGETKQYYQEVGGLNGTYYVKVITIDGKTGISNTINISTSAKSIKAYPNPVADNQSFRLEIKVTEADLKQAQLTVSTLSGQVVLQNSNLQPQMLLNGLPKGCYIIHVRLTNGELLNEKIMVN